jgi:hypothetical protein
MGRIGHSGPVVAGDMNCSVAVGLLVQRLAGESEQRHWSACASLWARAFAEACAAWDRWPEQYELGLRGLGHAFARTIRGLGDDCAAVLEAVRGRPVPDDDGSAEWGRALVFFAMVEWALDGISAQQCLKKATQAYLEDVFTIIANDLAQSTPTKVISHADAQQRVPDDQRWRDAVAFVAAI